MKGRGAARFTVWLGVGRWEDRQRTEAERQAVQLPGSCGHPRRWKMTEESTDPSEPLEINPHMRCAGGPGGSDEDADGGNEGGVNSNIL